MRGMKFREQKISLMMELQLELELEYVSVLFYSRDPRTLRGKSSITILPNMLVRLRHMGII